MSEKKIPCDECDGSGVREVTIPADDIYVAWDAEVICSFCNGTGLVDDDEPEYELEEENGLSEMEDQENKVNEHFEIQELERE